MIHILMPAYNEEEGLEKLLGRIQLAMRHLKEDYHVYIVNDGSVDRTREVVECFQELIPITLHNFERNQGVTMVFRKGFELVLDKASDDEMIVTLDSDNTQTPFVILDFYKKFHEGSDIVIASRFARGAAVVGVPWFRNILSNGVAFLLQTLFPIQGVRDYSTFYRAYRAGLVRKGREKYGEELLAGDGFSSMAGFLLKLCFLDGIKVKEVPIQLRYDLKEGGSNIRIFRTIKGYLKMIRFFCRIQNQSVPQKILSVLAGRCKVAARQS